MDMATFNRFRGTGDTNTTQALNALYRARPEAVVAALSATGSFGGLPEREIEATDREIDNLVYHLYGLTKKERALIESEIRR